MSLISLGITGLTNVVDKVNCSHPFLWSKLNFTNKVMEMGEEAGKDLLGAVGCFWTGGVDNGLGEGRVVLCVVGHICGSVGFTSSR